MAGGLGLTGRLLEIKSGSRPAQLLLADHAMQVRQDRFQISETGIQEPAMVISALNRASAFDDRYQTSWLVVFQHMNLGFYPEFTGGLRNCSVIALLSPCLGRTENRGEPSVEHDSSSILAKIPAVIIQLYRVMDGYLR